MSLTARSRTRRRRKETHSYIYKYVYLCNGFYALTGNENKAERTFACMINLCKKPMLSNCKRFNLTCEKLC